MKELSLRNILAIIFAVFLVAGCSSQSTVPETETETPVVEDTSAMEEDGGLTEEELAEQMRIEREMAMKSEMEAQMAALREVRTFYFDFDKTFIMADEREYIQAHAAYLSSNPSATVVLNGYADERGTKEYNLALGERRGLAVRDFLEVSGANRDQIEVVSFGEEFPADSGNDEAAWAKNRRVVLEYN